jgi:hypothetical protein
MTAETFIALIEEMIDLKIQQNSETHIKASREVARVLQAKRESDHQRLQHIRAQLAQLLNSAR